jgi:hypothetical protein
MGTSPSQVPKGVVPNHAAARDIVMKKNVSHGYLLQKEILGRARTIVSECIIYSLFIDSIPSSTQFFFHKTSNIYVFKKTPDRLRLGNSEPPGDVLSHFRVLIPNRQGVSIANLSNKIAGNIISRPQRDHPALRQR